jgi:small subunit ribosomal protein S8
MVTDPIADLINILKTGSVARKESVTVPHSNLKESILEVLQKEGFVKSFSKKGKKVQKTIEVELVYEAGKPKITGAARVSKPSKRSYLGVKEITPVRQGYGRLIVSTPKGILSDATARKEKVGGEPLFKIW